ncbi:CheR family methyltransferase [Alteromonas sp. BMJM2]|uniref:CheR family methyltransferase n=1 Tax=Alteromonas sp. BMJM2 TaxID=2954241 RepID=UPI0022B2F32E|nr:CheR family methyltransferase [Alteromonas sp. BMJM2]
METPETEQSLFWVGVGASAGGLDAIQSLCKLLPRDANMVYIIALHLSPKHDSKLTELIQRVTSLDVQTIVDGIEAQPNVVYITPPNYDVFIVNNTIHLSAPGPKALAKPSVNTLFKSLAEQKGERSIGVVLSGTGSDGAHGVKVIRASGGCTYAQQPESASYDGMPNASIDTDCVDFILEPGEIGKHLSDLSTQLPKALRARLDAVEAKDRFAELINIVRKQCGVSFKQYKKATLQRRIERRMLARRLSNFNSYVDLLRREPTEVELLYKDILISVTNFFRDPNTFKQLSPILDDIVAQKSEGEPLRLWVVGCATGEEAYSLAIMLAEAVGGLDQLAAGDHQIFSTDVDANALAIARRGVYSEASMADVPPAYREKYFKRKNNGYEIIDELKRVILFSNHNIADDPPFLRVDLITCRNLLIYFEQELQKKVYRIFHYSLRERGYMFLGKSESTSQVTDIFRTIHSQERIFQKRSVTSFNPQRFYLSNKTVGGALTESRSAVHDSSAPKLPETLIEQLGDACIMVNDNLDIEHSYGKSSTYIKFSKGKPSLNLSEIIIEVFKHEIRPLIYKALKTKALSEGQPRRLSMEGTPYQVKMSVYPIAVEETSESFLLVCFNRLKKIEEHDVQTLADENSHRVKELEDELSMAREHIQTVIEELETSNEELQSMNEELQSSNEELQSSNEELETTNEELQSTNEELVTMNDQLNEKTTAIERMSNQLVNLKNSLQFPLIYVDTKFNAVQANIAAKTFFSLQEDLSNFSSRLQRAFKSNDIIELTYEVINKEKEEVIQVVTDDSHYDVHVMPFVSTNNQVEGAILSFIDITTIMLQQKELEEKRLLAHQASQAKTEFLANVSHEIRTPLNAIVGVNEVFRLNVSDESKQERLLAILNNATGKLKALLNDLLDFAKLETGQLTLEYTEFSIQDIIRDLIELYSVDKKSDGITISTVLSHELPEQFIGDPLRIQQIVTNLLSNSIKFTDSGTIKVKAHGEWKQTIYYLVIEVVDTGIGMSKESVNLIFDKFTQANASIARRFGGSGLGLAIIRELVSLFGGTIEVESEEGEGSSFKITLPLRTPQYIKEPLQSKHNETYKLDIHDEEKVLVVEDNETNVFIISSYLDEFGVAYDVAENGERALEALKGSSYSVILLDLQMDGMDGFEFYERFKLMQSTGKHEASKVVAVSAHVHNDIIKRCRGAGMIEFLPKPVEISSLFKLLKKYLGK